MAAYYNEFDPNAAAWLRELIKQGLIAPGEVDERSIEDVSPDELAGFTQCHFFAGIGVWSYALRQAGWPDDRPVWTGSCPCQPFSAAGKGAGFADERHLWPHFHWLIAQCRPPVVFGEQVASKDGLAWWDVVSADLEGTGYTSGAVDTCAAGFGAPHIRQRLYWVAYADDAGLEGWQRAEERAAERAVGQGGVADGLAGADSEQHDRSRSDGERGRPEYPDGSAISWLADTCGERRQQVAGGSPGDEKAHGRAGRDRSQPDSDNLVAGAGEVRGDGQPSPTNGFWRDADWLLCRDGKFRPVEPGTFPLAHGPAARVGRLRGYGNAIVAPQAAAFVEAFLDFYVGFSA